MVEMVLVHVVLVLASICAPFHDNCALLIIATYRAYFCFRIAEFVLGHVKFLQKQENSVREIRQDLGRTQLRFC